MPPEKPDLDNVLAQIREEKIDSSAVESAAERVWTRIGHAPLRSCADFRALLPGYRAGSLAPARALLVEDHLRGCVACRKSFAAGRGMVAPFVPPRRAPVYRWAMAAALAIAAGLGGWGAYYRLSNVPGRAVLLEGALYRVTGQDSRPVSAGAELSGPGEVRAAANTGAVVRLEDGSQVEMRERAAFSVSRSGRDLTIHLTRGNIIVQAAKRKSGHLYVATRDCRVAVTGTVFSVASGVKGSRVAVIEGEVRVAQGPQVAVLHPGDQYATDASIAPVPVRDEIAWSRNAERHEALLKEFAALHQQLEQVRMPGLRYSSAILNALPPDTVVYAALPNLGATLGEVQQILRQRVAESAVLREWWAQKSHGNVDDILNQLRAASDYLGDEIVIAATAGADGKPAGPVLVAGLKRPGFREFVESRLGNAAKELHMSVTADRVVAAPDGATLQKVAGGAGGFAGTSFGSRISESYRNGAGIVFAADLEALHTDGPGSDLKYAVLEQRETAGRTDTHAVVSFRGARQGVFSWLGRPAAIGALDFVSPDAGLASAFTLKAPATLLDEVVGNGDAALVRDLAGALGGEFAVALDGPAVPVPSWKLVVEVYDPARLQAALEKVLGQTNLGLRITSETADGRTWYTVEPPAGKPRLGAVYTYAQGYLVAAPGRALVERALQCRATGYSLPRSAAFTALLPRDGHADFSAMVYQNLNLPGLPVDLSKPLLVTAYGEDDRITLASTGAVFGVKSLLARLGGPMPVLGKRAE